MCVGYMQILCHFIEGTRASAFLRGVLEPPPPTPLGIPRKHCFLPPLRKQEMSSRPFTFWQRIILWEAVFSLPLQASQSISSSEFSVVCVCPQARWEEGFLPGWLTGLWLSENSSKGAKREQQHERQGQKATATLLVAPAGFQSHFYMFSHYCAFSFQDLNWLKHKHFAISIF